MVVLAIADTVISVLDIAMLAAMLVLISFYTQSEPLEAKWWPGNAIVPLIILAVLFIAKNTAGYFVHKAKYRFSYNVAARISEANLLQYLEGNYHNYVGKDSSVHIRRISQQPVEFAHYVLSGIQQAFSESIMILLAVTAIIIVDAKLFLLLCIVLAPPLIVLSFYIKKRLSSVRANIKTSSEKTLQHLKEALAGYIESNVYSSKGFFTDRYRNKQQTLNRYLSDLQSVQILPSRFMEIFAVLGLLALVAFHELVKESAVINVLTLGAFLAAAYKIIPGLAKILNTSGQVRTYAFTAEDLWLQKTANSIPATNETPRIQTIAFRNVSFKYDNRQVLQNFNFRLEPGQFLSLTGISGKGKTTLINLLLGFIEPDAGDILINHKKTSAAERQAFWKNTSYVKQQPFLIHDTVLSNITLSEHQHNGLKLQQAVKASGLNTLLSHLPRGLSTIITENGKNISGGQRQRIALARAFYKNADLLLLDEPFNGLDEASEQAMLEHLQELSRQGKMILLITHNKKSLSFCTNTVSMDAVQ